MRVRVDDFFRRERPERVTNLASLEEIVNALWQNETPILI
jgi:hypothetical protein